MIFVLCAFIGELGFLIFGILRKRLRNIGVSALSILAALGLSVPFWAIGLCVYSLYGDVGVTPAYCVILALWLLVCFMQNFGVGHLARYMGLSEGAGLTFTFITFWAFVADTLIFEVSFSWLAILALVVTFLGGLLHAIDRKGQVLKIVPDP